MKANEGVRHLIHNLLSETLAFLEKEPVLISERQSKLQAGWWPPRLTPSPLITPGPRLPSVILTSLPGTTKAPNFPTQWSKDSFSRCHCKLQLYQEIQANPVSPGNSSSVYVETYIRK